MWNLKKLVVSIVRQASSVVFVKGLRETAQAPKGRHPASLLRLSHSYGQYFTGKDYAFAGTYQPTRTSVRVLPPSATRNEDNLPTVSTTMSFSAELKLSLAGSARRMDPYKLQSINTAALDLKSVSSQGTYPSLTKLLQLLCTWPVYTAACERSISQACTQRGFEEVRMNLLFLRFVYMDVYVRSL